METEVIFYILAMVIVLSSILAVTSKKVIHAATFLLVVLLATAGLFLILNFHYLFAVQTTVYAGGIMILFIMAIFLIHKPGDKMRNVKISRNISATLLSIGGFVLAGFIIIQNIQRIGTFSKGNEIPVDTIGKTIMGMEKYQYLLSFEVLSILLLACIVGAVLIAKKENSINEKNNDKI